MDTSYSPFIAFLGTGTLIINILSAVCLLVFLASFKASKKSMMGKISIFLGENSVAIALTVVAAATLSSLFLSEIARFTPCKLCWYQRIFMYPLVIILGISLFKPEIKVKLITIILSIIGLLIAIYHILLQYFPSVFPCSDEVANCALIQFTYFGYITIPVMSASAFLLIIILMLFGLRKKDK